MTILCYHSVEPGWDSPLAIDSDAFEEQCSWLARHRTVLDLPDAVAALDRDGALSRNAVALTFDDGLSGVYEHAFPVLRRYGLPATVFLVAQTLAPGGRQVDWVDTPPPFPLRTLTIDQIREMAACGLRFESHSHSHHDLTRLNEQQCEADLATSRRMLEGVLERPVRYLAYPRGRHNAMVRRAAQQAGYTHGFALPDAREPGGPYAIERVGIYPGNGRLSLRVKTNPRYVSVRSNGTFPLLRALWPTRIARTLPHIRARAHPPPPVGREGEGRREYPPTSQKRPSA